MLPFRMALLAALAASASACSTADRAAPVVRTQIIERVVPESGRKPCRPPLSLPDRDLTQAEATAFWSKDRLSLRECEQRRAAAAGGAP